MTQFMKAVLDHVGIAVQDLPAALAFYRDALGLEIEAPEEVVSQHVRAHFVPVGESKLELLEATRAGLADRQVSREARSRPASHHAARRGHQRGPSRSSRRAARGSSTSSRGPARKVRLVAFVHAHRVPTACWWS